MTLRNTIEEIKDRLDIVDVVESYIELNRKGSIFKALCPFHSEKTPSFVVFPDSQRWHCFGSCSEGGDVIDFVQKHEGYELIDAVRSLARRANVQMPEYNESAQRAYKKKRAYQEGLGVVAGYFSQRLTSAENAGRAYARNRGFSDDTIESGLLGYAPRDGRDGLLGHLSMHEMDPDGRAAKVALKVQGFAWHKGGALIYVHRRHGRVVYLSARAIRSDVEPHESKYNPPRDLAGERRAMLVGKPLKRAESVLIVEGQACAITAAAEWDAVDTAVAIAGADLEDEDLLDQMVEIRRVYIGLDDDETGRRHRGDLAERLGALTKMVTWPQKDANDLQRIAAGVRDAPEGFEAPEDVGVYVKNLMRGAPTWLDLRIEEYNTLDDPQERAEMSEEIAALYGDLPQPIRMQIKDEICNRMSIGKRDLDNLVKSVWQKRLSNVPYATKWGMLCRQNGLQEDGTPKWTPVASFDARVVQEVVHDNGIEREIHFVIKGALNDGSPLPTITVEADEYPAMRWPTGLWGAKAYAMEASPHHLRRGILELSDPDQQTRYTHTGWREVDGKRVFLFNGGAVGSDGSDVDVELDDSRLKGYVLNEQPGAVSEAMEASLRFLELTDLRITGPLWAAMYLAPLSEIIEPDFVPFIYGKTGAMKSTITALALNHFGSAWNYNRMPASWTDTVTSLEMKSFAAKDVPLVVDDYARDVLTARSQDKKAQRMIRAWGNRANRARRKSDLSAQKNFPPRGMAIVSGEQLPSGQSIIGRLLPIEVRRDDLVDDEAAMARLNACQNERTRYAHAMSAYLLWLREQWPDLKRELPREWERLRDHQRFTDMTHQRIPAVIAKLYCGFDLAMKFAQSQRAIEQAEAQEWRNRFFDALLEDALDHSILVEEEDPIDRFVRIIRDDVAQGKIWFEGTGEIADMPMPGNRTPYAEKLGFLDQDWLYVFGESTLSYIQKRCRQTGDPFPLNRNALYSGLTESTLAVPGSSYTTMQYKGPGGQNHRVLKLYASEFGIEPQEDGVLEGEGEPEPIDF